MKKLKLSELNLSNTEVLTRKQLKKILGGAGSGGSSEPCAQCCWINYPADCSECACGVICTAGAFLAPCFLGNIADCFKLPGCFGN